MPGSTRAQNSCPADEWGYRYWDALEYLKNRGVKHIVIGFAQIVADSVLNLVEIQNQIGKEIGTKTWLYAATGDTCRLSRHRAPLCRILGHVGQDRLRRHAVLLHDGRLR